MSERPLHLIYDDPQWAQRVESAAALRRLGNALVRHRLTDLQLRQLTDFAEQLADAAEQSPAVPRPSDYMARRYTDECPPDGAQVIAFSDRPFSGPTNPMAMEVDLRRRGDAAVADVVFGAAFESAPDRAHGGAISAIVDDTMGYLMVVLGIAAYTAKLTVNYRAGVPIGRPIRFTAAAGPADGRKLTVELTAVDVDDPDGATLVEAEALFLIVPAEQLASD